MSIHLKIKIDQYGENLVGVDTLLGHLETSINCFIENASVDIEDITEKTENPLRFFEVIFASRNSDYERYIVRAEDAAMAISMSSEFCGDDLLLEKVAPIREGLHPLSSLDTDGGVLLSGSGDGYYLTMHTNPREKAERELSHARSRSIFRQRIEREVRAEIEEVS